MENNNTVQNVVHGFKVFRPDWTCDPTGYNPKQYTCPGKFEEEGELDVCGHGMHFCQTAADCFNYYSFNSENKVAEVIAYGEVRTEGDKSCTDTHSSAMRPGRAWHRNRPKSNARKRSCWPKSKLT